MEEIAAGADDEKPTTGIEETVTGTEETVGDEGPELVLPVDLEREVAELRRRLIDTPRELHRLESEVRDVKRELARANARNQKLTSTIETARERITTLRDEVEKLSQPPSAYGTVLQVNDDGSVDVYSGGRKMRVGVHPELVVGLQPGQEVVLNDSMSIVLARTHDTTGEVVTVKEVLVGGRRARPSTSCQKIPLTAETMVEMSVRTWRESL